MGIKRTVLAAGLGVIAGFFVKQQLDECRRTSPEHVLNQAKEAFKERGPISGSWIYMKPEEVERNGLIYRVYRGGITRNIDGETKRYEFYADVETGTIIESTQTE